jgi:hypothetical protein
MDAPQIQYAPVEQGKKQRRIVRKIALAAAVFAVAPILWKCGNMAIQQLQMLHWQQKAMAFEAPPDRVVLDTSGGGSTVRVLEWERLYEITAFGGSIPQPVLFLHARKNPNGEPRLVVVHCRFDDVSAQAGIWATVFRPGSIIRAMEDVSPGGTDTRIPCDARTRFFAGQADRRDPTHFTIEYDADNKRMLIDAYLHEDDGIYFSTRRKQ